MSLAVPTPDRREIARTLDVLHPDGVVELRALFQRGRKRTAAGYFDGAHRQDLVEQAAKLNEQGAAVYITMNALDAQLLGRYANRIEDYAQATATDTNVIRRRWLLIDIDPQRPKDTSASAEQLEAAMDRARNVYRSLTERGWPKPVVAESGNGAHLLYRIDLENNDASRDLVKGCLEALARKFDDEGVRIDRSVFNAGRIVKLHGTIANKGDNVPTAPWRLARLLRVPDLMDTVPVDLLQALAAEGTPTDRPKSNGHDRSAANGRAWGDGDVAAFLARGGIETTSPEPHDGALRWKLKRCPFNPEHGQTESAVFLASDGRLGFKCQHNSCADKHWRDLRELVDGPRESRKSPPRTPTKLTEPGFVSSVSTQERHSIQSLPPPLPAVPAFDTGLLPETVRPWVEDHAKALQCPPEYVGVGAMVALAGTIGRQVAICVKQRERWIERSVLWGCIVGRPSAGKSPALRPAYGMLTRLEGQSWEHYQQELREYEARQLVATAAKENARKTARKKLDQGDRGGALEAAEAAILSEEEPQQARLVVNDGTVEAIGAILNANPRGLVQFRDELSGWLASLDREGREGDRAFWLECWAGAGPYVVDRIGRGTVRVEACAVSILGGTQPGKLAEYVRACCKGGSGDDGLLPRFQLAVYPDAPKEWRYLDREPNQEALEACWRVFQRLNGMDASNIGAERSDFIDVPFLRFSQEAQGLFAEWQTDLMGRLRAGKEPPFLESHFAKYPALVARLALVIHLADAGEGAVSAEALGKALDWTEYLEGHARRIYAPVTDNGLAAAHALLAKRSEIPGPFTLRELHRKGWAGLDREAIQGAIDWLDEYGHLTSEVTETGGAGGRPTIRYQWRAER